MFLFCVMAHWFGRLPLPCCRVIGIFTQELVLSFQVSVDSSNYNMTAIVLVAFPVFRTFLEIQATSLRLGY